MWALATYDGKVVSGGGDGTVRLRDVTLRIYQKKGRKDAERSKDQALRTACNRATLCQR